MKENIENFFYHYKYHVIGVIVAIILLVSLFKSCTDKKVIDLKMVYFSDKYLAAEDIDAFEKSLRENNMIEDVDGDGEKIFFMDNILYDFDIDGNTDEAILNKVLTVTYAGDHTLMLVHKYGLEDYDGSFEDISKMARDTDDVFYGPETKFVTGISVEGNEYLESHGINTENLYLAMRRRTEKDSAANKDKEFFDSAYKVMEFILSGEVPN